MLDCATRVPARFTHGTSLGNISLSLFRLFLFINLRAPEDGLRSRYLSFGLLFHVLSFVR